MAWMKSGPVVRHDLLDEQGEVLSLMLPELKRHMGRQGVGWTIFTSEALYAARNRATVARRSECRTRHADLPHRPHAV